MVQVFYAFLFSPVRHIPGPWWARLSKLPLLQATYERRRSKYASDLLAQGPVVVIAPYPVHTNDSAAMQAIYSRKSLKTPFYAGMGSWKGVISTLGFVEYKDAAPTSEHRDRDILVMSIPGYLQLSNGHWLSKRASQTCRVT